MNKLTFFILVIIGLQSANAQITFQKTYGDTGIYSTWSAIETFDGGILLAGYKSGDSTTGNDIFFIRTDANGDTLWTKSFGGTGNDYCFSARQTSDSGFIAVGSTTGFGNGIYLIKTSANGTLLWSKVYGSIGDNEGYSVEQTSDGGYIITGVFDIGSGSLAIALIKTDSTGNLIWTNFFEGLWGSSVKQTFDGGYIITGVHVNDICLIKTDSLGNIIFWKAFGTTIGIKSYSVRQTADGGFIIGGYVFSGGGSQRDLCLIKTDSTGDMLWAKSYSGIGDFICYSMELTHDGGFMIAGAVDTTFSFSYYDVLLLKTDSVGNVQWAKSYGDQNYSFTQSAIQASDGGFIIGGIYYENTSTGNTYAYLIKTDSSGNSNCNETNLSIIPTNYQIQIYPNANPLGPIAFIQSSPPAITGGGLSVNTFCFTTGIQPESLSQQFNVTVYPNPSAGSLMILFQNSIANGNLTISNILSEVIFEKTIFNESKTGIDIENMADGIYLLKISDGEKSLCRKIIVAR